VNSNGHFIFLRQTLGTCSLFDALWYGSKRVICFELNTMQTTMFTKLYPTVDWISRNNEQVGTSYTWSSHRARQIPLPRHPSWLCAKLNVLCTDIFLEVEDCEGGHLYRFIFYSDKFSNLKITQQTFVCADMFCIAAGFCSWTAETCNSLR